MSTMNQPPDEVRLRALTESDVLRVLALNEAEVEMLAPMDELRLRQLRDLAHRFDVVEVDGAFGGFVITFAPGSAYDSENYRWFRERHGDGFYYLDRFVLAPPAAAARGRRAGLRRGRGRRVGVRPDDARGQPRPPQRRRRWPSTPRRGYVEVGRLGDDGHLVSLQTKSMR